MDVRKILLRLTLVAGVSLPSAASATIVIYTDAADWAAHVGTVVQENFAGPNLTASGLSVVSDNGKIVGGHWSDKVAFVSDVNPVAFTTTWSFTTAVYAFG